MSTTDPHSLAASRIDQYLMQRAMREREPGRPHAERVQPVITISRSLGVPIGEVAKILADELGFCIMDRQVLDAVSQDTRIGDRILESLDEGSRSALDSWISAWVDYDHRLVDAHSFYHMLCRLVRGISLHGSAIILGRGANFVLKGTDAFRVRLTAPSTLRAEAFLKSQGKGEDSVEIQLPVHGHRPTPANTILEARREIAKDDKARRQFIATYFRAEIDDPEAYDAVFCLRRLDPAFAAGLILDAYRRTTGVR